MTTTPSDRAAGAVDQRADSPPEAPRTILRNAVVAAVLGSGLMVLVHELVHLVTGLALGVSGTLYPYGVEHRGSPSASQLALIAGSAPVLSLASGYVLSRWLPLRRRGGFAHLLWLWFAFTSMMEGVGYLVITPFGAGDTATVATAMGWPVWVQLLLCAGGTGLMFVLARLFAPHVGRHAGSDIHAQRAFAMWPWLLGTVANVVLSTVYLALSSMHLTTGEMVIISLAGMATLVFAPMSFIFHGAFSRQALEPLHLRPLPVPGLAALAVLVVVNLALLRGLTL